MSFNKIKLIIVGDTCVGKTSIIQRYYINTKDNSYSEMPNVYSTIGIDFRIIRDNYNYKPYLIEIWDPAGQEKYRSIIRSFYKNKNIAIIVVDITQYLQIINFNYVFDNNKLLEYLNYWINEISTHSINNFNNMNLFIAINKLDTIPDNIYIQNEMYIKSNFNKVKETFINIIKYFNISVKNNKGINEMFLEIIEFCDNNNIRHDSADSFSTIDLQSVTSDSNSKKCC